MNKFKKFISNYQLPFLSGIMIGTSYIPFPPWAMFFCLTPLLIFCKKSDSLKKTFYGSWITQYVLTLIGFNWVAHTIHEFGNMPWAISIVALLLFCGFASLHIPLAMTLWHYITRKWSFSQPISWLLAAIFLSLFEFLSPTIFSWNYGYLWLWAKLPGYQLADIIGFSGLSFLTIFVSCWVAHIWLDKTRNERPKSITLILVYIFVINGLGWFNLKRLPTPDKELSSLVIQANIGNLQKQYAERGWGFREYIVGKYLNLGRKAFSENPDLQPQFMMWPETAFPEHFNDSRRDRPNVARVLNFLNTYKVPLVAGAYGEVESTGKTTNSIFIVDENTQYVGRYDKTHLLAFGEYIPGETVFPILREWITEVADFAAGKGPHVVQLNDISLGLQICYESLFPDFSRDLSNLGADILINVTNDSWYGPWQEPYQHLYMTLARGIEFRRPLIRATNTGFSTAILADGTLLERSQLYKEQYIILKVPYIKNPQPTFYQKNYLLLPMILFLLAIILIGRALVVRTR